MPLYVNPKKQHALLKMLEGRVAAQDDPGEAESKAAVASDTAPRRKPPTASRLSYAAAEAAGWLFATTGANEVYAWRLDGRRTIKGSVGLGRTIADHYRAALGAIAAGELEQ